MKARNIIAAIVLLVAGVTAKGQQEAMVSQYMFNGLFLNPAYAGSHKYFSSTLLYRSQWVNFDGAPQTFTAAVDGPLADGKMGVGLLVMNDRIGVTNQTDASANYSYNVKLGPGKLAFGLKAGISHYNARLSEITYWDNRDPVFGTNIRGQVIPRFGFGMYYFQEGSWYAGFSIPTLLGFQEDEPVTVDVSRSSYLHRHYYLNGGYVFDIAKNWKLKPSVLVKYLPEAPVEADINVSAMYLETIWVGVSYRSGDAIVGILEYQANKRFRIGYSYDMTLSRVRNYSDGSHEIMVGYDFGKDFVKIKTPRYF